ncbi:2-iminobutanoate/2-iminopropanoate deaminase [Smittium culicis]|uniref:2-iminobutanoate/2-iminopropanoate deaminase n=1 Tax=Smittium culicis TaxID=133412 RepID=A0A1R1Y7N6_9FUNG|nr:2-iminobutanoate/2-iminopropanoate deaminase [Smittium culicis]
MFRAAIKNSSLLNSPAPLIRFTTATSSFAPRPYSSAKPKPTVHDAIVVPNSLPAIGPYSKATKLDNLVFTSGQLPLDPATNELVGTTIEQQTRAALNNLHAVLKSSGSDLSKVLKTTVYLNDIHDYAAMNDVYASFFSHPFPARSAFQVAKLPKDAKIEIECIAYS